MVKEYNRKYYEENRQRIIQRRRALLRDKKFREALKAKRREYYDRAQRKIYDSENLCPEVFAKGDLVALERDLWRNSSYVREKGRKEFPVWVDGGNRLFEVEAGKRWLLKNDLLYMGGYEYILVRGRVRVHFIGREKPKVEPVRTLDTPRLYRTNNGVQFLYGVGALTTLLRRHPSTMRGWLCKGVIPSVEAEGEHWIKSTVFEQIKKLVKCLDIGSGEKRHETSELRQRFEAEFGGTSQ